MSAGKKIETIDDPRYVKALSHPLRVRILGILERRAASPVELADLLKARLGVVSYHVRELQRFGLIELTGETKRRGAIEHHYRARPRPTISDLAWSQATPVAKQAMVGAMLQLFGEYATRSAAVGGFDRPEAHITRTSMRLDRRGWEQLSKACWRLLEQSERIRESAEKRLAATEDGAAEVMDVGLIALLFEGVDLGQPED